MLTPLTTDDPRRIGPYRLTNRIGAGGMGVVYLGFTADGGAAAVKVPASALVDDPRFRTRFRQEVAAASRVRAASVAAVLDADATGPRPWLATEYVEGRSLAEAVRGRGPFDERLVLAVAVGLADALVAIHAAGVVHRDLKPANILLAWDGPRVIDFGVARDQANTSLTQTGSLVGTLAWMSPEQLRGERVGPAADIFAWGACVAFAAAGRPAFRAEQAQVVALQILTEEPLLERLPPQVDPQVRAALTKDPNARPSAADILAALLGRPAGATASPSEADEMVRRWWVLPPSDSNPPPEERTRSAGPVHPRAGGFAHQGAAGLGGQPLRPGQPHGPGGTRWAGGTPPPPAPHPDQHRSGPGPRRRRGLTAALVTLGAALLTAGAVIGALLMSARDGKVGQHEVPYAASVSPAASVAPSAVPSRSTAAGPRAGTPAPTAPSSAIRGAVETPGATSTAARRMPADEAAATIRAKGYEPDMSDYNPRRLLNVIPGARRDAGTPRMLAFVFADGEFQGTDTKIPSGGLTVRHDSPVDVTVTYRTYAAGGTVPVGSAAVRYHWNGDAFVPLDPIPSDDVSVQGHR